MKNILIEDGKEGIFLYSGMTLKESDINPLERILSRLLDKIGKLERNVPTPEETRLNILEHSHDTLLKAQIEAKKMLEEMKAEVSLMSRKLDHAHKAHIRIYNEIDMQGKAIAFLDGTDFQRTETDIKRDKRISDIEDFLGDL